MIMQILNMILNWQRMKKIWKVLIMMNYRKNFDETSVLTDERRENIMKLSEWNEIISYAKELCQKRTSNIRPITYSMYDGRKGIYLALYDSEGKLYDRIASGVHDTVDEYKKALDSIYNIICELI